MEYTELNNRIAGLKDLAQEAAEGRCGWGKVWGRVKEIGGDFKNTRYPSRGEREEAWNRFQGTVEHIRETQDRQREESERQVKQLERQLGELERHINDARRGGNWKEVWSEIKKIGDSFKHTRFVSREDREAAWDRFQELVGGVKERQSEEREQREDRARESVRHRDEILRLAERGRPPGLAEDLVDTFLLRPIAMFVEVASLGLLKAEIDDQKADLQARSKSLKEAWELFHERKQEMLGRDKQEAFERLREVQEELNGAWDAWKQAQDKFHEAQRASWRERVEGRIEKLESRLENLYGILSRREAHLSELEDKRDSAWSDDFRDRVEGWIDEEESRISDIKEQISKVEGWLDEERGKL